MNRFELVRYRLEADLDEPDSWDLAVPIIDGRPLADRLEDRCQGTFEGLVAWPSKHWLGQPERHAQLDGRAEILTGSCGISECCGVFARIVVTPETVTWTDFWARGHPPIPVGLSFTFDRAEYERAIRALETDRPKPEPTTLLTPGFVHQAGEAGPNGRSCVRCGLPFPDGFGDGSAWETGAVVQVEDTWAGTRIQWARRRDMLDLPDCGG